MKPYSFLAVVPILLMTLSCSNVNRPVTGASPTIRVLLCDAPEAVITPQKSFIFQFGDRQEVGNGRIVLRALSNGIEVNGVVLPVMSVTVSPSEYFEMNGVAYRGAANVIDTGRSLLVVNSVDIESYLYGVVPGEMPVSWDREALKAQAVVARTYALYEIVASRNSGRAFDVYGDTRSQVYKGLTVENKFTTLAVDDTLGEVIKYRGAIIKSYFHACTGGATESCENVFGERRDYLVSRSSPYGMNDDQYKWQFDMTLGDFRALLGDRVKTNVVAVNVLTRTDSKRIATLEILDAASNRVVMAGTELRTLIGTTKMKSTRANILVKNGVLYIFGMGYGHGVGMGQYDAEVMALKGITYDKIIAFFYRGVNLSRVW